MEVDYDPESDKLPLMYDSYARGGLKEENWQSGSEKMQSIDSLNY